MRHPQDGWHGIRLLGLSSIYGARGDNGTTVIIHIMVCAVDHPHVNINAESLAVPMISLIMVPPVRKEHAGIMTGSSEHSSIGSTSILLSRSVAATIVIVVAVLHC